uniref:Uncharacterized protein n=1 Tax=Arundo donax TaxID=35708 RepID=A0A0A9BJ86_ARUDO
MSFLSQLCPKLSSTKQEIRRVEKGHV